MGLYLGEQDAKGGEDERKVGAEIQHGSPLVVMRRGSTPCQPWGAGYLSSLVLGAGVMVLPQMVRTPHHESALRHPRVIGADMPLMGAASLWSLVCQEQEASASGRGRISCHTAFFFSLSYGGTSKRWDHGSRNLRVKGKGTMVICFGPLGMSNLLLLNIVVSRRNVRHP